MEDAEIAGKTPSKVSVVAGKNYFWCACGKSKKQPFCDGSHKKTDKKPIAKYFNLSDKKLSNPFFTIK